MIEFIAKMIVYLIFIILPIALFVFIWYEKMLRERNKIAEKNYIMKKKLEIKENSNNLVEYFGEKMQEIETNSNPIFSNIFFSNFYKKYSPYFDFIESSVSEVINGTKNWEFLNKDFVQFLSLLIYSKKRENYFLLDDDVIELLKKLQKILETKSNIKIRFIELRNLIAIKIFYDKYKNFNKTYNLKNLIDNYFKSNGANYYLDDIAFIYYSLYDFYSDKKFIDIINELKKLVEKEDLKNFKNSLLSEINETITIEDLDIMDGKSFEKYIGSIYRKFGYQIEFTQDSNDQGVDIIATNLREKIAIQTKCYSRPVGNKAVQEVIAGTRYYNCNRAVVITNSHFTKSAKDLAKKNNVILIDREQLINIL